MISSMKAQGKFWAINGSMLQMADVIVQRLAAPVDEFVCAL